MPELPFVRVVSASSADPRHPAENLLRPNDGGRWRGAAAGEKQMSVVLELGESRPIHSVHVGNDGAAFVEILVGSSAGGDFQVLLPSAAMMSPSESRAGVGEGQRRVRLFGPDSLVKGPAQGTWDRLRVVLSQPYCQSRSYGLSFVRVFAAPEDDAATAEAPVRRLGPFAVREGEGSPPRALFHRRSPAPSTAPPPQATPPLSYAAAALRDSAGSAHKPLKRRLEKPQKPQKNPQKSPENGASPRKKQLKIGDFGNSAQNSGNLSQNSGNSAQNSGNSTLKLGGSASKLGDFASKFGGSAQNSRNSSQKFGNSAENSRNSAPNSSNSAQNLENSAQNSGNPSQKLKNSPKNAPKSPKNSSEKSGKNPKNSPKNPKNSGFFSRDPAGPSPSSRPRPLSSGHAPVLGGVTLVLSGFQNPLRGRLRAAALDLGARYRPDWTSDSTHLVCAFARTPKAARAREGGGVVVSPDWIWDCQREGRRLPCGPYLLDGSASPGSEEEEPEDAPPPPDPTPKEATPPSVPATPPESDSDGEDQSEEFDPYGGSTEENSEDEEGEGPPIPPLPDFFQDKTFFFHGDFPPGEERRLLRYVVAFGGTLAPYMTDSVTHVVTAQDWDPAFEEALELRPSLTFVRPHWLLLCGERQRPLPAQPFAVVPRE